MMKHQLLSRSIVFVLAAVLVVACSNPPNDEMDAATAAVALAEDNEDARVYASALLAEAKALLLRMRTEADEKRYDSAKSLAQEATDTAQQATRNGAAAKARARDDATTAISAAKTLLADAERAFISAREVEKVSLDVVSVGNDLRQNATTIASAESDFAAGGYDAAKTKAEGARSSISALQRLISDAVQAATRSK